MQHCTPVGIAATGVLERQMSAVRQMRDELVHELWGCLHAADKDAHASSSIAIRLAKAVQGAARVHVAFLSIAEKYGWANNQFSSPVNKDWMLQMISEIKEMQM